MQDVPESSRYEIRDGDRRLGLAAYRREGDRVVFTHTEVEPEAEGTGVGGSSSAVPWTTSGPTGGAWCPSAPSSAAGSASTRSTPTWSTPPESSRPAGPVAAQSTCWPYISPSGSAISSMRAPSGSRK